MFIPLWNTCMTVSHKIIYINLKAFYNKLSGQEISSQAVNYRYIISGFQIN